MQSKHQRYGATVRQHMCGSRHPPCSARRSSPVAAVPLGVSSRKSSTSRTSALGSRCAARWLPARWLPARWRWLPAESATEAERPTCRRLLPWILFPRPTVLIHQDAPQPL